MSVARIRTGGRAGANASHASSASVYASSPVAQAAHQTRTSCEPAACARSSSARQGIVSSCWRSRKKKVSLIVTSSISVAIARGPSTGSAARSQKGCCISVRQRTHDGRAQRWVLSRLHADAALAENEVGDEVEGVAQRDSAASRAIAVRASAIFPIGRISCRAALRCFTRHAVDGGGLLVLGDRQPAGLADRAEPVGAVAAHAGQDDGDACAPCVLRDASEQSVGRRSVQPGGVVRSSVRTPSVPEDEVGAVRGEGHAGKRLRSVLGESDRQRHGGIEPARKAFREAGRDVLDDEDRDGKLGGMPERSVARACGPPVEAQIPITEPRGAAGVATDVGRSAGRVDGGSRARRRAA